MSEQEAEKKTVKCHGCGIDLNFSTVEALKDTSRTTFLLRPSEGSLMRAETVGGVLTNLSKLIRAIGKQHNVQRSLLIEGMRVTEDGALEFNLLECFVVPRQKKTPAGRKTA